MAKLSGLTAKQRKFIELFIETGNKSQSYREAYGLEENPNMRGKWVQEGNKILDSEYGKAYFQEVREQYLARVGDKAEFVMRELMDDIAYRDEKGKKSPTWAKSIDLLQKQLGLQSQKVDASISTPSIKINIGEENDD